MTDTDREMQESQRRKRPGKQKKKKKSMKGWLVLIVTVGLILAVVFGCSEFVMCYPPGIPILAPGEMITREIIDYIIYAKEKGCSMQGMQDPAVESLFVLTGKY